MIPENIVKQLEAVQAVVDGSVSAGGGIQGSVDLAAALPEAVTGSSTLLSSLGG
ncbi:MAG: hypothetical protein L0H59_10595 [Tomitella sp.]|nr:hypothetical protein [Tomitella sp.]